MSPHLGTNPETNCDCFFVATKTILAGEEFLWYYGPFHGVFKTPVQSEDSSDVYDNVNCERENDAKDDDQMALKLSMELNNGDDIAQSISKTVLSIAKQGCEKIQNASSSGAVAPMKETTQKRKRKAIEAKEAENERIREEALVKYRNGDLKFVPTCSPDHSSAAAGGLQSTPAQSDDNRTFGSSVIDRSRSYTLSPVTFGGEKEQVHETDDEETALVPISSDESDDNFMNESGLQAAEAQKVSIDMSDMNPEDIWDGLFANKKLKGGCIARTLFISAKKLDPKLCDPWIGGSTLCTKKQELIDQRKLFLQWANESRVLKWIRNEIYRSVVAKPQSYKLLDVKHREFPLSQAKTDNSLTLAVLEATDDVMGRIAHLACCSDSRTLLHMIYGRKTREHLDSKELQPPALWQDLADQFVNNEGWKFEEVHVAQLDYVVEVQGRSVLRSKVDPTKFPRPGISGDCVRDVFNSIKSMFATLANKVFARTGCNSTGEELYGAVWTNYIKGKFLYFSRPEVAMYVFKLWNETEHLPKYCVKELHPDAQIRVGVGEAPGTFVLPVTPRSSSSAASLTSPPGSSTSMQSLDKLASYLEFEHQAKRNRMQEEMDKPKVSRFFGIHRYIYFIFSLFDV